MTSTWVVQTAGMVLVDMGWDMGWNRAWVGVKAAVKVGDSVPVDPRVGAAIAAAGA